MQEPEDTEHLALCEADDRDWQVLKAVGAYFKESKSLVIIGPLDDEGICDIRFTNREDFRDVPSNQIDVDVDGKSRRVPVRIRLIEPPVFGPVQQQIAPPVPPTGRSMGGDAVWQASGADHGTAAFFARNLIVSPTPHSPANPAQPLQNAVLSCRHVLAGPGAPNDAPLGSPVSMVNRPAALTLHQKMALPVDVATAVVAAPGDYHFLSIRALGSLTGIDRARKHLHVHKYGARTGLTSGVISKVTNWKYPGQMLRIFEVRGQFACVHDSGAAVVNGKRELVGIVFAGSSSNCDLNRTTFVMAVAPYRQSNPNDTLYIEFS